MNKHRKFLCSYNLWSPILLIQSQNNLAMTNKFKQGKSLFLRMFITPRRCMYEYPDVVPQLHRNQCKAHTLRLTYTSDNNSPMDRHPNHRDWVRMDSGNSMLSRPPNRDYRHLIHAISLYRYYCNNTVVRNRNLCWSKHFGYNQRLLDENWYNHLHFRGYN